MACFVNWVDLAWKTSRDTNGSLKHISIFNSKQSLEGRKKELLMGVVGKKRSRYERNHDGQSIMPLLR